MIKYKQVIIITILLSVLSCKVQTTKTKFNNIKFEISDYSLLFTKVEINGKMYTALIDFGDFAEFQISTKLINELKLSTKNSDVIMSDIDGNQYALEEGILHQIKIGDKIENNVTFYSANNEIDAVSQEVGTDFQVVVGYGYFRSKDFKLDFVTKTIEFLNPNVIDANFSFSKNTDYGYLIGNFVSNENEKVNLLFDTGTPISKIDTKRFPASLKDSTVKFLNTEFPSKLLKIKSMNLTMTLNMESSDISELEPLGVVGIYGVNDMIGKVFLHRASENLVRIETAANN